MILFDKTSKDFVLEIFQKQQNEEGYITEKGNPDQKILSKVDSEEVRYEDFAGVKKGSEIFFKADLISIIRISDELKEDENVVPG